ncbi:thioesterase domain-containing protein [Roseibium sp.]|uniref:thioesterase domain-containing protein n=1 Tax=Roseibium sp. TaxID=1936156 RepID=UPI003A9860E9
MDVLTDFQKMIVTIQEGLSQAPIFVAPQLEAGPAYWATTLASLLGPAYPVHALERLSEDGVFSHSLTGMARRFVSGILDEGFSAPFHLIGYSFGAQVAHAMAVEFQDRGHDVGLVGIVDDDADVHRRVFDICNQQRDPTDPVATGFHAVDRNPLTRLDGKITLFQASFSTGTRQIGPASDWEFLASGGVDVFDVPCTHGEIVTADMIARWVEHLKCALALASSAPSQEKGKTASYKPLKLALDWFQALPLPLLKPKGGYSCKRLRPRHCHTRVQDVHPKAFQGFALAKSGDLEGEIRCYEEAISVVSDTPDWIFVNLSIALSQNGEAARATELLWQAVSRAESIQNCHLELAKLLGEEGRGPERSRLAELASDLKIARPSDWKALGILLQTCNMQERSITAYKNALVHFPRDTDGRNRLCMLLMTTGRPTEAKKLIEDGLRLEPGSQFLKVKLGETLSALGETAQAEAIYREVLRENNTQANAIVMLATLLRSDGRNSEALELLRKAQSLVSNNHKFFLLSAEICLDRGHLDVAEADFRTSINLNNREIMSWIGLFRTLQSSDKHDESIQLLIEAPSFIRQNPRIRQLIGELVLDGQLPVS